LLTSSSLLRVVRMKQCMHACSSIAELVLYVRVSTLRFNAAASAVCCLLDSLSLTRAQLVLVVYINITTTMGSQFSSFSHSSPVCLCVSV
jgi:hypothetical protein